MNFEAPIPYRWQDPSLPPQAPALSLHFEHHSAVNDKATRESGIQTYDDVLVAVVAPMGQPKSNAHHEVERTSPDGTVTRNEFYWHKYAQQIALHKAGTTSEAVGTPLRDLVGMTPSMVLNLKSLGLHTIEMLADAGDSVSAGAMGFWEWRDKARKHIEAREKNAPTVRLEMEIQKKDDEIASLTRRLDELAALVEDKTAPKKKAA